MNLVGPERRGLAMGLNEAAGCLGVAGTALATSYIAAGYGLRPGPFLLGAAFIAIGLMLSVLTVREARHHARAEAAGHVSRGGLRHHPCRADAKHRPPCPGLNTNLFKGGCPDAEDAFDSAEPAPGFGGPVPAMGSVLIPPGPGCRQIGLHREAECD